MSEYINIPTLGALLAFAVILYLLMYFNKPAAPVASTLPATTTTA